MADAHAASPNSILKFVADATVILDSPKAANGATILKNAPMKHILTLLLATANGDIL